MGNRYKFTADITSMHQRVSGSLNVITIHHPDGKINFLVDCGLYQGEEDADAKNYAKFPFNPQNIDFILLTHNHTDHIARVPALYKEGCYSKIYTTEDTTAMLPIAMENNEKIINLNAKRDNKKPLYDIRNVENVLNNVVSCKYNETFSPAPNVRVTFFKNGHLIGSAIILIQISCADREDINLLFTGDYKKNNIFFDVPTLPYWVTELPLHIICESTYGDVDSAETNNPTFLNNICNWLSSGINTILIPALSLGRYQEVAYTLKMAQINGLIDCNIPIKFDGNLAIKYSNLYKYKLDIKPDMRDFMPQNACYVKDGERNEIIQSDEKQIIVTTSGMGSFGPAQEYIPRLIERADVGMHFTSYLSPDTLGYKLISAKNSDFVLINSVLKRKLAKIEVSKEFSSHAKRDELIEFLEQFDNIRTLFINHGEVITKKNFSEYCKRNLKNCKEVSVLGIGYTVRIDTFGIVKEILDKNSN